MRYRGESRIIDFQQVFAKWNIQPGDMEYPLVTSLKAFQQVGVDHGTLAWKKMKLNQWFEKE